MSDWSEGYVTNIEYITACYPDQGPIHLDLMALLAGVEPPGGRHRQAYCELGAGQGLTATLIALTNPGIDVHAVDFMPGQVARARDFADALGLDNVTFHEASFLDMAEGRGPVLPDFDYVTMHGVYSWVSRENQNAIVKFMADKLRPGGLVYTSYNAMPGWGAGIPVQRLLSEVAGLTHGSSVQRVAEGFDLLKKLYQAKAVHLTTNELARDLIEHTSLNPAYMAHEYLNQFWRPLFFADVARDFAGAKLEYVGPARPVDLFDQLMMTEEQIALTDGVPDPIVAETLRDYCRMRTFRVDIHVKGLRRMPAHERDMRLASVPLALTCGPTDFPYELPMPRGVANLPDAIYRPMIEALAEHGPATLSEILSRPGYAGKAPGSITECIGMLLTTRKIAAAAPLDDATAIARCRAANRRSAMRMRELATREGIPVAMPALRNAGHIQALDLIAVHLINAIPGLGDDGLVARLADLAKEGDIELPEGDDPERRLRALVADRRRIWRHLGLID